MNAEMKSAKWFWGGIGLQLSVGYTVAYLVYTVGTLASGEKLDPVAALGGLFAVLAIVGAVSVLAVRARKRAGSEKVLAQ